MVPDRNVWSSWRHASVSEIRRKVAQLLDQGLGETQIAWELRIAPTTVSYHAGRLALPPPPARSVPAPQPPPAAQKRPTRDLVQELLAAGLSRAEAARQLDIGKATVSYHARRLGEALDVRCARRYDWAEVQRYYDAGHSMRECRRRFGFASQSWHAAVGRGALKPRPHAIPLEALLTAERPRNRQHIKSRLLAAGVKRARCEECGLAHWRGGRLSMSLHHVNGDRHDNRLENLLLLCPNCHSQTPTFAGRNRRRPSVADGEIASAARARPGRS